MVYVSPQYGKEKGVFRLQKFGSACVLSLAVPDVLRAMFEIPRVLVSGDSVEPLVDLADFCVVACTKRRDQGEG